MMRSSASVKLLAKRENEYKLTTCFDGSDNIYISLVDEKHFVRYSRHLNKKSVKKLGKAVGYNKNIEKFWEMFYNGIRKTSKNVTISVLNREDAELMIKLNSSKPKSTKDNYIYIIMRVKFEFECFYFPILLKEKDYSSGEMLKLLVKTKNENQKLYKIAQINENKKLREKVQVLENKIVLIKKQKDEEIEELREQIYQDKKYYLSHSFSREAKSYAEDFQRYRMIKNLELT